MVECGHQAALRPTWGTSSGLFFISGGCGLVSLSSTDGSSVPSFLPVGVAQSVSAQPRLSVCVCTYCSVHVCVRACLPFDPLCV